MAALEGIRVLDFGRYVAGPYCAALLADFGADVIRIEPLGGGDDRGLAPVTGEGEGAVFLQGNRNKRSLALNPRGVQGREVVRRLVATADVVIVNVPESALAGMGLDYESLAAIRPDIVLTNISSFGPEGPWSDRPGFDSVGQAMCGSAWLTGTGEVPFRSPVTWVDNATGVYAAFGTMVALFERARTGRGQKVGASLLATALAVSSSYLIEQAATGKNRVATGNRGGLNGPTDGFRTKDGWIVTQVVGQAIFRRLATLIDEPGWLEDPRFANDNLRGENGAVLSERMARWCAERTSTEALDALAGANVPAGPVLSPADALGHPQVTAMGMFQEVDVAGSQVPVPLLKSAVTLGATPGEIRTRPPRAGEHTAEILEEIGFGAQEIQALLGDGVVSRPEDPHGQIEVRTMDKPSP